MNGATTGGPHQSLIDDPTFISYLDDLDRGVRTNNGANDEAELPADRSPASPQVAPPSPSSPLPGLSSPPTGDLADGADLRASFDALDWGLPHDGARHEPPTSGSPTIVPQLLRHPPASTAMSSAPSGAPVAWPALGPSAAAPGARPLLGLFPGKPTGATCAFTPPAAQTRARPLPRDVFEPPMPPFSDVPDDDSDFSADPTVGDDGWSESRAPQLKRLGFAAFVVGMMLLGASIGALVFHARVSRIIVQWESVSTRASPSAATHPSPK